MYLQATLHSVFLSVCLTLMDFGSGRPLPGSPPIWCCIKAHSSWCWQSAEGKPCLKGKCWEPQEPQRTSDCSAIILPRLSCTWKGKQKTFICPIQRNQNAPTQCQLCGRAWGQHCCSAFSIMFALSLKEEQVCTWKHSHKGRSNLRHQVKGNFHIHKNQIVEWFKRAPRVNFPSLIIYTYFPLSGFKEVTFNLALRAKTGQQYRMLWMLCAWINSVLTSPTLNSTSLH